jgi:hypothetical protein
MTSAPTQLILGPGPQPHYILVAGNMTQSSRRIVVLVFMAWTAGAACSDDSPSVLEDACRVVVDDCGVGDSVGACLDALGDQLDECLACVAESGCSYGALCAERGCDLPGSYLPH